VPNERNLQSSYGSAFHGPNSPTRKERKFISVDRLLHVQIERFEDIIQDDAVRVVDGLGKETAASTEISYADDQHMRKERLSGRLIQVFFEHME
jgi:hypothetical protein